MNDLQRFADEMTDVAKRYGLLLDMQNAGIALDHVETVKGRYAIRGDKLVWEAGEDR